jgi:hypothetical protein
MTLVNKACFFPSSADDPDLVEWVKDPSPWVTSPPPGFKVNCFRDPFVLEKPCEANGYIWRVMIGSAIELQPGDKCCAVDKTCNCVTTGTAIVYRTKNLHKGTYEEHVRGLLAWI